MIVAEDFEIVTFEDGSNGWQLYGLIEFCA
jgi:hypothetical protein